MADQAPIVIVETELRYEIGRHALRSMAISRFAIDTEPVLTEILSDHQSGFDSGSAVTCRVGKRAGSIELVDNTPPKADRCIGQAAVVRAGRPARRLRGRRVRIGEGHVDGERVREAVLDDGKNCLLPASAERVGLFLVVS